MGASNWTPMATSDTGGFREPREGRLINHRWPPSYHVNAANHRYGSSPIAPKPDRHSDVCYLTNPSLAFMCSGAYSQYS